MEAHFAKPRRLVLGVIIAAATVALLPLCPAEARTHWAAGSPEPRLTPGGYRWTAQRANGTLNRRLNRLERKALWRAKMATRGELGHDRRTLARLFNFTFNQLRRRVRELKRGEFTRPERRKLIMSGWLDYHLPPWRALHASVGTSDPGTGILTRTTP